MLVYEGMRFGALHDVTGIILHSAAALIEAGLPAVGQWISILDQVRQGDFCQVDCVRDEAYLVEA